MRGWLAANDRGSEPPRGLHPTAAGPDARSERGSRPRSALGARFGREKENGADADADDRDAGQDVAHERHRLDGVDGAVRAVRFAVFLGVAELALRDDA